MSNPYEEWRNIVWRQFHAERSTTVETNTEHVLQNARLLFETFQDHFIEHPEMNFNAYCRDNSGSDYASKPWRNIKIMLDQIYFGAYRTNSTRTYPSDLEHKLFTYMEQDPQTKPLVLKCLLEFGQYEKFMRFLPLEPDIIMPRPVVSITQGNIVKKNGSGNKRRRSFADDLQGQNTYLAHAIMGSRKYGIPSVGLIQQCMNVFHRSTPMFVSLLAVIYPANPRLHTGMDDKTRLEWIIILSCLFERMEIPPNVHLDESTQRIELSGTSRARIQRVEEFQYIVKKFFQPMPLPTIEFM